MDPAATDGNGVCHRNVDAAVHDVDGVTPADVATAADRTVARSTVGDDHEHSVFELTGLDCPTCAALVETVVGARAGVSNVTATPGHGTVRVDYDPVEATPGDLREALAALGYPVETTDEAFDNRQAAQWREARLVTGLLAGLMALVPYAAVVYPTRFGFWPAHPRVVALLERALETAFATHFYINLALLSGIVLVATGKPILEDAEIALRARSPDRSLAVGVTAVALYLYSSATAFRLLDGGVYYDVVILVVVAAAFWRQAERAPSDADAPADTDDGSVAASPSPPDGD